MCCQTCIVTGVLLLLLLSNPLFLSVLQAVLQLNLCRVLQDPTGEQTRPLVVRRANMRKPASALMLQLHLTQHATASHGSSMLQSGGGNNAGMMMSGSSSQTTAFHATSMSLSGGGNVVAANAAMNAAAAAAGLQPSNQGLQGVMEFAHQQQQQQHGGMEVPMHLQPMGLQVRVTAYDT
jgi:hypothetical protein